jgi:hypothetical protein
MASARTQVVSPRRKPYYLMRSLTLGLSIGDEEVQQIEQREVSLSTVSTA